MLGEATRFLHVPGHGKQPARLVRQLKVGDEVMVDGEFSEVLDVKELSPAFLRVTVRHGDVARRMRWRRDKLVAVQPLRRQVESLNRLHALLVLAEGRDALWAILDDAMVPDGGGTWTSGDPEVVAAWLDFAGEHHFRPPEADGVSVEWDPEQPDEVTVKFWNSRDPLLSWVTDVEGDFTSFVFGLGTLPGASGRIPTAKGVLRASGTPRWRVTEKKERGPDMKVLKRHKVRLTDEEREAAMKAGACWHHGPGGERSCAIWKSRVNGRDWYCSNTHRAYACDRTLKAAIKSFGNDRHGIRSTS